MPIQYLKCYLVGIPQIGKTTTKWRLVKKIRNLSEQGCKTAWKSTGIADCSYVMVSQDTLAVKKGDDGEEWSMTSNELEEALEMYAYTGHLQDSSQKADPEDSESALVSIQKSKKTKAASSDAAIEVTTGTSRPTIPDHIKDTAQKFDGMLKNTGGNISASKVIQMLLMIDVGGQSAFLEMLPLLMKGPALYLAFFKLSAGRQSLEDMYFDKYNQGDGKMVDEDKVSNYSVGDAIIQILSSVALSRHPSKEEKKVLEILARDRSEDDTVSFQDKHSAVAFLIGTYRDELVRNKAVNLVKLQLKKQLGDDFAQDKLDEAVRSLGEHPTMEECEELLRGLSIDESLQKEVEDSIADLDERFEQKILEVFKGDKKGHKGRIDFMDHIAYAVRDSRDSSTQKRLIFSIDNMHGGEKELQELRGRLMEEVHTISHFRIPVRWLVFGILLRMEFEWITMSDCIFLAKALHIDEDELDTVLWFLASITGMILYQPDIEDPILSKVVFCGPQVIFNSISDLIIGSIYQRQALIDEMHHNGIFSLQKLEELCQSKYQKGGLENSVQRDPQKKQIIPLPSLISLLEYRKIIASTSDEEDGDLYIMPAALDYLSGEQLEETLKDYCQPKLPCPLLVKFYYGYPPPGLFSCILTTIIKQSDLYLVVERKRNFINFWFDDILVALVARAKWYEVYICNNQSSYTTKQELCDFIQDWFNETLTSVLRDLSFGEEVKKYEFCVKCAGDSSKPEHTILIEKIGQRCRKCYKTMRGCELHECWKVCTKLL